ncbi:hypothetical protein MARPO_0030s0154 [Marchantia polymorpha]|uniref:Uncharacterized protein n=1 Tax=Marchantia polymorpha TaxID=3197 RepID=A0A2R6X8L3_MARPO|nr:hypothetical protein MARPO_0030s0154 [Marchantia polymorpha]|eukprot:PTQ42444.1 hypothetical protein MARPO_0030s0154 [Marchantia polymorpha]
MRAISLSLSLSLSDSKSLPMVVMDLVKQGGSVQGTISRQDAAYVCAEALDAPPENALVFEVVNGAEDVEDWSAVLTSMKESRAAPS